MLVVVSVGMQSQDRNIQKEGGGLSICQYPHMDQGEALLFPWI